MEINASKYQAAIFCELSALQPETTLIQSLFTELVSWNVFPNIVQEFSIEIAANTGQSVNKRPTTVDRMQFISSDRKRKITILTNRIEMEILNPEISVSEFHKDTIRIMSAILGILEKKASRISLVTSYFNPKNLLFFDKSDSSIMAAPTIEIEGEGLSPSDWDQRFSYTKPIEFSGKRETLNLNVFFGRRGFNTTIAKGSLLQRLELTFDINTSNNAVERFGMLEIISLYDSIFRINEEFKTNILKGYSKAN